MSVFHPWLDAMAVCLGLMVMIKDKGLARDEEEPKPQEGSNGQWSCGVKLSICNGLLRVKAE